MEQPTEPAALRRRVGFFRAPRRRVRNHSRAHGSRLGDARGFTEVLLRLATQAQHLRSGIALVGSVAGQRFGQAQQHAPAHVFARPVLHVRRFFGLWRLQHRNHMRQERLGIGAQF